MSISTYNDISFHIGVTAKSWARKSKWQRSVSRRPSSIRRRRLAVDHLWTVRRCALGVGHGPSVGNNLWPSALWDQGLTNCQSPLPTPNAQQSTNNCKQPTVSGQQETSEELLIDVWLVRCRSDLHTKNQQTFF